VTAKPHTDTYTRPPTVLGGGGLGLAYARHLSSSCPEVRLLVRAMRPPHHEAVREFPSLRVIVGDVRDVAVRSEALAGGGDVYYCIASSIPSASPRLPVAEISTTLPTLDATLTSMAELGAGRLVYLSSGGTIYGDQRNADPDETTPLAPTSSYGLGKSLSEDLIRFYGRVHGVDHIVLRVANVYGCPFPRQVPQGFIDICLQRHLDRQPVDVWGSLDTVRDYVFIDDLMSATRAVLACTDFGNGTVNIGSGVGHSLREVLEVIGRVTGRKPVVRTVTGRYAGVSRNVLDCGLLRAAGWRPVHSLEEGISRQWRALLAEHCDHPVSKLAG